MTGTLGFHRGMALAVFGPDSPATKYLDRKIAESPNGEDEKVVQEESQVVYLLMQLHTGATTDGVPVPSVPERCEHGVDRSKVYCPPCGPDPADPPQENPDG